MSAATLDDLVGLDLVATMSPERRRRFHEQIAGIPLQPVVPSGLAPFLHLPPPEPATLTRARLAKTLQDLVAANGLVTRDDLVAAGFTPAEIERHFGEAKRIAGLARMAV